MAQVYKIKTDCFAWNRKTGKCNALKSLYCRKEECTYYKPKGTECNGCKGHGTAECLNCKDIRKVD